MGRKRYTPEQIISKLREAEVISAPQCCMSRVSGPLTLVCRKPERLLSSTRSWLIRKGS